MHRQPPQRHLPRSLRTLPALLLIGMTAGCHGYLEFEGETPAVTVSALLAAECPVGWTGDTVATALADDLEQSLYTTFASIGDQADSEIARRNAGSTDAIKLISLSLQMTDTANATDMQSSFGFLSSLDIYLESTKPGSSLPRRRIAHNANIPQTATTLPLQVDEDVDLQPYRKEGLRISADMVARSCLRHPITYRAAFIGRVRPAN